MAVEVTLDNFDHLLPSIIEDLSNADFVAVDCEFTGLVADERLEPSLFDDGDRRYNKLRISASKLVICQVGLSTFSKVPSCYKNQFSSKAYHFYLCKRSCSRAGQQNFLVDISSAEFLTDNSFDFNKWIKSGIPFLNASEAKLLKEAISSEGYISKFIPDFEDAYEDDFAFIQLEIQNLIEKGTSSVFTMVNSEYRVPFQSTVNNFKILVRLKILQSKFPKCGFRHEPGYLFINLDGPPSVSLDDLDKQMMDYMKGFTRLFDSFVQMKKILIGHNMLCDLIYLYNSFIDPLPKSYNQFKREINSLFPVIYDTKHIFYEVKNIYPDLRALVGKAKSLLDLFEGMNDEKCKEYFFHLPIIETPGPIDVKAHNASFDSFATGCVFIRLIHSIICHKNRSLANPPTWQMYIESIGPVVNRVNIIRASVNHVNLEGEDGPSSRPPWLYVRKVVKNRSVTSIGLELNELLLLLGRVAGVDVVTLNTDEFLVAVPSYQTAEEVLKELKNTGSYSVAFYSIWKHHWLVRKTLLLSIVGSACVAVWCLGHVLR